jgi:gliding motility-associated-like protein
VYRTRNVILLILLLLPAFNIKAQTLPSACTESWVRYASTPDTSMQNSTYIWIVEGDYLDMQLLGAGNDSVNIHWGRNPGIYRLGICEVSEYGCPGDTVWSTIELKGAVLDLGADIDKCRGDTFSFTVNTGFDLYKWNNNSPVPSNHFMDTARVTDTITVEAINSDNCRSSDTAVLIVHPLPNIVFTADGKDTSHILTICENQKITLGAGNDGLFYDWSTKEFSPYIMVNAPPDYENQIISVTVTSDYGCKSQDSIEITSCSLKIASGFTPNGDGVNDKWEIPFLAYYPDATVDVYDRWGSLVYHSEHGYKPWDGRVNGIALPTDSYIYIIKQSSKATPIVGHVTIIK